MTLKEACIFTHMPAFFEHYIVSEMVAWRKNNQDASEEEEKKATIVLLETVSADYKYGYVDREMPTTGEKKRAE